MDANSIYVDKDDRKMALRLIEIILKKKDAKDLRKLLKNEKVLDHTELNLPDDEVMVRVLLDAEQNEVVLDLLEKFYSHGQYNRVIILPVEATLPRAKIAPEVASVTQHDRISREELYEDIKDSAHCSKVYLAMIILSTIVASVGLCKNSVAIIIGAMVIAPMLGPSMALALATTLGDLALLKRSLLTGLAGVATAMVFSTVIGVIVSIDPATKEIASRTLVGWSDLVVAFASGCAGALAFTSGVSATLIGVMVAVALLPPLVTFGLLLGSGYPLLAVDALLLFLMNIICVNIAGVLVFLAQGISPLSWYERNRAKNATRTAIGMWIFVFVILIVLVILLGKRQLHA
jgi:uncharacterized hydrophobic protein (TIGR00341 family)